MKPKGGVTSRPRFRTLGALSGFLAFAALSAAAGTETFTGTITDSICASSPTHMGMGPTDGECTLACIDVHGATYALKNGRNIYALSDQKTPEKFAGQKVSVVGTLDAKTRTIRVDSIRAAK